MRVFFALLFFVALAASYPLDPDDDAEFDDEVSDNPQPIKSGVGLNIASCILNKVGCMLGAKGDSAKMAQCGAVMFQCLFGGNTGSLSGK